MKITLNEVRRLVRSFLLREVFTNKCTKCGYDNPYMDPVDDYVCRQCRQHAEVFGSEKQKPVAASVAGEDRVRHIARELYQTIKQTTSPDKYGNIIGKHVDVAPGAGGKSQIRIEHLGNSKLIMHIVDVANQEFRIPGERVPVETTRWRLDDGIEVTVTEDDEDVIVTVRKP